MKDPKGVFKSGGWGSGEESEPCISKSNHVGGIGRVLADGGHKRKRMQKGEERAEMCLWEYVRMLASCISAARQNQETCKATKQETFLWASS